MSETTGVADAKDHVANHSKDVNTNSTIQDQDGQANIASSQGGAPDLIDLSEPVTATEKSGVENITKQMDQTTLDNGQRTPLITPSKQLPMSPPPPDPPSESEKPYLDPTPRTPAISRRPSEQDPTLDFNEKEGDLGEPFSPSRSNSRKQKASAMDEDNESVVEIQSIMDQFQDATIAPTKEEIMSPRLEKHDPMSASIEGFPPRRSSLEPLRSRDMDAIATSPITGSMERFDTFPISPPPVPPKPEDSRNVSSTHLPIPDPEPELPFDFHRFLEQLRHKSADPVARFLRSFLTEFGKKQWAVHEQVKLIGDFLAFITNKMAHCEVWREVSDNEFENAKEGMEKLVMNRLYSQTFSPALPPPPTPPRSSSRKRKDLDKVLGPGRRGQHQEDVERDDILAQKIRIYGWVREEHLDIPSVGPNGERFLRLAQQELVKIKSYRAPRDKVVCILNCCKVIFGLLKNAQSKDTSADSFVPLLIYVVLQSNPEHLVSNIQYILRFRNQDRLAGEAGYYLSSLSGAIQFIENLDRTSLTVSDEDFEQNVEEAVSRIAAQNRENEPTSPISPREKSRSPRASTDTPRRSTSRSGNTDDDAVGGLLRTIGRPLSSIGRFLSDTDTNDQPQTQNAQTQNVQTLDAQTAAARQASAESDQARRIQRAEHNTVVETLAGMFPNLDREVIDDVVRQKQGRVGLAVDACLALTAGG